MGGVQAPAPAPTRNNYKRCANNTNSNWWLDPALRWNVFHCIGLCGTLFFNGYDGSLFNGLQTIDAWQEFFHHPKGNTLGLMNSAALFPGLVAPYFAEMIASRFGRRWAVWTGIAINSAGAIVNSAATSLGMYIAGRALMGVGISMGLTIAPTLLQEFAHPRFRAQIGSLYTTIYYIAAVISASICLGTRSLNGSKSWRIPCYLQLVGPVATLLMTVTMPESPRWLAKNGRAEEALQVLVKYHTNGGEADELVLLEHQEILRTLQAEAELEQGGYLDYLKPNNRHRLFILVAIAIGTNWVGNGIVSYYLSPILNNLGIKSTRQQACVNLGLQCWNLVVSTTAALSVEKVGRRPLWLLSTVGMLFSFSIVMALSGSYAKEGTKSLGIAVIPFLFIYFGFYTIAWTPLSNMYSVEILPYTLRTKGQAIYNIVQGSANAVNQWVNPIILSAISWKYYGVYVAILAVYSVLIYFGFPETKGLTIEEIDGIFDGNNAVRRARAAIPVDGEAEAVTFHVEAADKLTREEGA
ncbi:hypothetical protein A1O3_10464 [Capronia epimyces CBS 606.96]|uniref:Major facilitator superfamily (MFS) profile domain-containing protein n=1 Tax=Capronia epimyces CBS 606.96 TaxID=1182542 RepID=W9XK11_9EURO|nr:uncharacterized protein A1O3_10464 [Capronia epimyces CBS 606.96]EXJ77306.1 hypothetical protein A1O3_10464 [Capronia epimyces CBS 606.96]